MKINKLPKNKKSGFTMIEMMVAISVFLVVIMFGIGSMINAYGVHKRTAKVRSILDNMSFIMEDMSRTLRVGSEYSCDDNSSFSNLPTLGSDCTNNGTLLAFKDSYGQRQFYALPSNGSPIGLNLVKSQLADLTDYVQLNPDEIVLNENSHFIVTGADPADGLQPYIKIQLSGEIHSGTEVIPFSLQTSVSQRLIDVPVLPAGPAGPGPANLNGNLGTGQIGNQGGVIPVSR